MAPLSRGEIQGARCQDKTRHGLVQLRAPRRQVKEGAERAQAQGKPQRWCEGIEPGTPTARLACKTDPRRKYSAEQRSVQRQTAGVQLHRAAPVAELSEMGQE